ncbi:unnamed protein product [Ambrosiozyma monospora]|uniref:Unnamed protein product n=1 Tax=Ambrosiozyma monospora TaxID=43982 RepID=A0ACB5U127_AMBMO|nr:unnamed protein product [Ambrosiozyma monospora]
MMVTSASSFSALPSASSINDVPQQQQIPVQHEQRDEEQQRSVDKINALMNGEIAKLPEDQQVTGSTTTTKEEHEQQQKQPDEGNEMPTIVKDDFFPVEDSELQVDHVDVEKNLAHVVAEVDENTKKDDGSELALDKLNNDDYHVEEKSQVMADNLHINEGDNLKITEGSSVESKTESVSGNVQLLASEEKSSLKDTPRQDELLNDQDKQKLNLKIDHLPMLNRLNNNRI